MHNTSSHPLPAAPAQRRLPALFFAGLACLLAALPVCGHAQTNDSLQLGLVDFNAWRKNGDHPAGLQLEYRSGHHFRYGLQPMAGILTTREHSDYVYGGVYRDFALGQNWRASAEFSAGLYRCGRGKNLGGPIEFQSGVGLYRRLAGGSRVGLEVRHLSHAHIYRHNPGTENIILFFSLPLH